MRTLLNLDFDNPFLIDLPSVIDLRYGLVSARCLKPKEFMNS